MILIVDDDEAMADTCSMLLEAHGFNVEVVASGDAARSKIKGDSHQLIISDCAMPGLSGIELSDSVRADPATAQVPILLMSGSLRCDVAKGNSYDAFLRKPFLAEHLLNEVRKLLEPVAVPAAVQGKS